MSENTPVQEATPPSPHRPRWIPAAIIAAIIVAGTAVAVPVAVQSTQAAELAQSQEELTQAKKDLDAAVEEHQAQRKASADVDAAVDQVLTAVTPTMVDPAAALTTLTTDSETLKKLLAVTTPTGTAADPKDKTTSGLRAAKTAIAKAIAALTSATTTLHDTTVQTVSDLLGLVGAAEKAGPGLSFPKAGAAEQNALAGAVTGLRTLAISNGEPPQDVAAKGTDALIAYAAAFNNATASQNAAIAAEQAPEQEAQHQSQEDGSAGGSEDASDGGWSGGGSSDSEYTGSNGGSSGGGSTGGNSGGSSGGNSGGSSGGGQSAPSYPRGSIVRGGACDSASGSSSANWTSNLVAPTDAVSVWVSFENPGSSWGIGWNCVDF